MMVVPGATSTSTPSTVTLNIVGFISSINFLKLIFYSKLYLLV
jgi:hypothetical protein